jgi:hypothetical protein
LLSDVDYSGLEGVSGIFCHGQIVETLYITHIPTEVFTDHGDDLCSSI